MKILFCVKAGIGNQIQQTHIYFDLLYHYGEVDVAVYEYGENHSIYFKEIARATGNRGMWFDLKKGKPIWWNDRTYDGVISCLSVPFKGIPVIFQQTGEHIGNEVAYYENIYRDTDISKGEHLPLDWSDIRGDMMNKNIPEYDVLICNGSVNSYDWIRKRYQRHNEIIEKLQSRYSVGCVGLANEYVYPADDLTEQGLMRTFDIISKCRLLISNDTGLMHFASVIGVPCIALFTATNLVKNINREFHKNTVIFKPDVECFPCQGINWCQTERWKMCGNWHCGEYESKNIVEIAEAMLLGIKVPKENIGVCFSKVVPVIERFTPDIKQQKIISETAIESALRYSKKGHIEKPDDWRYIPEKLIDRMWFENGCYVVRLKSGRIWRWEKGKKK